MWQYTYALTSLSHYNQYIYPTIPTVKNYVFPIRHNNRSLSLWPSIAVELASVRSQEVDLIGKVANSEITCGSNVNIYFQAVFQI